MTSFMFWVTLMSHSLLWGSAYAQIIREGKGTVIVLYNNLLHNKVKVDKASNGEIYYIYSRYSDEY
nr:hypothetical protein [Clostridium beijerinckii]